MGGEKTGNGKILILIPAYRDYELSNTIKSALKQAEKPENLVFAVVNQYGPESKGALDLFRGGGKRFRLVEVPWQETLGVGWVRHLLEELYRDEEYVLQIDAHMQFGKNWDKIAKENWKACKDERAVISSYPVRFDFDEDGKVKADRGKNKLVRLRPAKKKYTFVSSVVSVEDKKPEKTLYVTGGMEFYKGEMLKDVRYIKEIAFTGEEVVRSLQLWTHGYNVYAPVGLPIYHHYGREEEHRFWNDMQKDGRLKKFYDEMMERSNKMVDEIMSGKIEKYQKYFGTKRTVQSFLEKYASDSCND